MLLCCDLQCGSPCNTSCNDGWMQVFIKESLQKWPHNHNVSQLISYPARAVPQIKRGLETHALSEPVRAPHPRLLPGRAQISVGARSNNNGENRKSDQV